MIKLGIGTKNGDRQWDAALIYQWHLIVDPCFQYKRCDLLQAVILVLLLVFYGLITHAYNHLFGKRQTIPCGVLTICIKRG